VTQSKRKLKFFFNRRNVVSCFTPKLWQDILSSQFGGGYNIIFKNLLNAQVHIHDKKKGDKNVQNWQTRAGLLRAIFRLTT